MQHCGGVFWPGIPRACGSPGLALKIESVSKSMTAGVRRSFVAVALAAALVGGCASGDTGAAEVWDPIETPNRFVFAINRTVDMVAVRPLAVMYRDGVPEPAQKSVRNLLDNLGEPVTAINEVFQGDPSRAATTMARFLVNSTLGVAGLFDVATMFGMKRTKTDAGQTIGMWAGKNVEPENGGFYLMLPLAGPADRAQRRLVLLLGAALCAERRRLPLAHHVRARRPREEQRRLLRRAALCLHPEPCRTHSREA